MANKYIVRQAIKDAKGEILGYEILYHGENQAFGSDAGAANDFAAADTIYSFYDLHHYAFDEKNPEAIR